MDWIPRKERMGYYKDTSGEWRRERREVPDRRGNILEAHGRFYRRSSVRRAVDREILSFLSIGNE